MNPATEARIECLRLMWAKGMRTVDIAKAMGLSPERIYQLSKRHGLPPRKNNGGHYPYQDMSNG
jgi:uncharacterized protein YjcR